MTKNSSKATSWHFDKINALRIHHPNYQNWSSEEGGKDRLQVWGVIQSNRTNGTHRKDEGELLGAFLHQYSWHFGVAKKFSTIQFIKSDKSKKKKKSK